MKKKVECSQNYLNDFKNTNNTHNIFFYFWNTIFHIDRYKFKIYTKRNKLKKTNLHFIIMYKLFLNLLHNPQKNK